MPPKNLGENHPDPASGYVPHTSKTKVVQLDQGMFYRGRDWEISQDQGKDAMHCKITLASFRQLMYR